MALARVVSFDGVTQDRMAHLKSQIETGDPPEGMPPAELMILHDPEGDQHVRRAREPAQCRANDEQDKAGEIQMLVAEEIARTADTEQQCGDDQQVHGRHPLDAGDRCTELTREDRQQRVHDAAVEGRHKGAHANGAKHPPAGAPC